MLRRILRGIVLGAVGGILGWASYAISQPLVSPERACRDLETFFPKVYPDNLEASYLASALYKICHREPILSIEEKQAFIFDKSAEECLRLMQFERRYKEAIGYARLVKSAGPRSWLGYWLEATALSEGWLEYWLEATALSEEGMDTGIDKEDFEQALSEARFWGWDPQRYPNYPMPRPIPPDSVLVPILLRKSRELADSERWGKIVDLLKRDFGQKISDELLGEIQYYIGWASYGLRDYKYAMAALEDALYYGFRLEHRTEYGANAQMYLKAARDSLQVVDETPAFIPVLRADGREVDNEDLFYEGGITLVFPDLEYFSAKLEEALPPDGRRFRPALREKEVYLVRGRGIYRSELNISGCRWRALALGLLGVGTLGFLLWY